MKVILIRHGKTPGNLLKQYIGRTDQSLAEEGIAELKDIADSESFCEELQPENVKTIYVSPMKRCKETAKILFPNADQIVHEDLREMDFGIFEEKNYKDLENSKEYDAWLKTHCESKVPDGEQKADFSKRSCEAFLQCLEQSREQEEIYFLVHGGTIMSVLEAYGEPEKEYYKWYAENGHGYTAIWKDGKLTQVTQV